MNRLTITILRCYIRIKIIHTIWTKPSSVLEIPVISTCCYSHRLLEVLELIIVASHSKSFIVFTNLDCHRSTARLICSWVGLFVNTNIIMLPPSGTPLNYVLYIYRERREWAVLWFLVTRLLLYLVVALSYPGRAKILVFQGGTAKALCIIPDQDEDDTDIAVAKLKKKIYQDVNSVSLDRNTL